MSDRRKVHAIVNPHAGHGKSGKKWPLILDYLKHSGFDVTWQLTKHRWHAYYIAQEYVRRKAKTIVSVGGEGVMNEILNGMFAAVKNSVSLPTMAMIPIGTGTDLSRTLKIPKNYRKAVDVIKKGKKKLIDAGLILFRQGDRNWSRYFINASDAGLGGAVARITNSVPKTLGGFLTFLLSSLVGLLSFRRMKLKIWVDGKLVDQGLMTIVGALNGQFFGGGMHAAPMAVIDDGTMEFMYVKDTNFFKFLIRVLARVYQGEHLAYHKVHLHRGKELNVQGEKVFLVDVDGEVEKAQAISLKVLPKVLRFVVPD